jgi:hypothetical protein
VPSRLDSGAGGGNRVDRESGDLTQDRIKLGDGTRPAEPVEPGAPTDRTEVKSLVSPIPVMLGSSEAGRATATFSSQRWLAAPSSSERPGWPRPAAQEATGPAEAPAPVRHTPAPRPLAFSLAQGE